MSSYPELQGKVAVVTGSSRRIGLETATRLASNGASVGIVAGGHQAVDDAVGSIQAAGGRAVGVAADATSLEATERVRERIESELGAVDIVAAFAGSGTARPGRVHQLSEDEWHSTVDGNLTATFLTLKTFLPGMIERRAGSIVSEQRLVEPPSLKVAHFAQRWGAHDLPDAAAQVSACHCRSVDRARC